MKTCRGCGQQKSLADFHKDAGFSDGHKARCKSCAKITTRKRYLDNREFYKRKSREYSADNRERYRICNKQWREKNRAYDSARKKKWNEENKERVLAARNMWRLKNKEQVNATYRVWLTANREHRQAYEAKRQISNRKHNRELQRIRYRTNPNPAIFHVAQRRAMKYRAAPAWANRFFIEEIYDLARLRTKLTGFKWHVDHVVPLKSPIVCGLHWEGNLKVIPATENIKKKNHLLPSVVNDNL